MDRLYELNNIFNKSNGSISFDEFLEIMKIGSITDLHDFIKAHHLLHLQINSDAERVEFGDAFKDEIDKLLEKRITFEGLRSVKLPEAPLSNNSLPNNEEEISKDRLVDNISDAKVGDDKMLRSTNKVPRKIRKYSGIDLYEDQVQTLQSLELLISEPIPAVGLVYYDSLGFAYSDNEVTELGLNYRGLNSLPPNFINLTKLKSLNLGGNKFSILPESICTLTNLQYLDLRNNKLISLPENIVELTQLEDLNIDDNKLTSLPEEIGKLRSLITLDVNKNNLTNLPESICNLINLKLIMISKNRIVSLPEQLDNLVKLQTMNFSGNKLPQIPVSIGSMKNLEEIYLTNNRISSLPENFFNLEKIRIVNLGNNRLEYLSNDVAKLSNLEELILNDNNINSLPESIGLLGNCTVLDLNNNLLTLLPSNLFQITNLTKLRLGYNKIECLPDGISNLVNLRELILSSNQLTSIPDLIGTLSFLSALDLGSNKIVTLPENIGQLVNLEKLSLENNQLATLPEEFFSLINLTALNLGNNHLESLSENIGKLANLLEFNIRENQLSQLPNTTSNLLKLISLDVESNKLQFVFRGIENLKNLKVIHLSYNPIFLSYEKLITININSLNLSSEQLLVTDKKDNIGLKATIYLPTDLFTKQIEWLKDPHLHHLIQNTNKISITSTMLDRDLKIGMEASQISSDQKIRENARKIYSDVFPSDSIKLNLKSWAYVFLGVFLITIFRKINTPTSFSGLWIEILLFIFFLLQIYQGFTIQEYAQSIIRKFETSSAILTKFPRLNKIERAINLLASKLRSSFGMIITIFWIISFQSLKQLSKEQFNWNFIFLNNFVELVLGIINRIEIPMQFLNFPSLHIFLFSGFTGILLRVVGILAIFWAINARGWGILISPKYDEEEERKKGIAKHDWYEVIALPLGILISIFAIIVDNSDLSQLPSILFQIGLLFGGLIHFMVNTENRKQMILTIILLIILGLALDLLAKPVTQFGIFFYFNLVCVIGILSLWYFPYGMKPSFFRLIGRPFLKEQKSSRIWLWLAREFRFDVQGNIAKRGLKSENLKNFDLMSFFGIITFYIVIPSAVFKLLINIHTSFLILMILAGLIFWYRFGLPREIRRIKFKPRDKIRILLYTRISMVNFRKGEPFSINLRGLKLKSLPKSIGNLDTITNLDVRYNQLTSLPDTIGNLTNLVTLNLRANLLKDLPASIGDLSNLQELTLGYNQLKLLPYSVGNLDRLQILELDENSLKSLPESISQLTKLTKLDLTMNKITSLPNSLGNLISLSSLMLYKNEITHLPDSFSKLVNLQRVHLDDNKLKFLPNQIWKLKKITYIGLGNNPFTPFSSEIEEWLMRIKENGRVYM